MARTMVNPAEHGWTQHDVPGFSKLVGPFWRRDDERGPAYGFLVEDHHLNGNGIVHGGMLMTFIDQAIGMVVYAAIERKPCATIQLNTHFLDAGRPGEFIEARAEIVRKTRSVVFTRGALTANGRLLLSAEGIWKILRADSSAPAPEWG